MIKNISHNCPMLQELNLFGSDKIGDSEIDEIALCKQLLKLVILGTKITGTACQKLLKELDNLRWLEHCAFNCKTDSVIFESRAELFNYIKHQLSRLLRPHNEESDVNSQSTNEIEADDSLQSLSTEESIDDVRLIRNANLGKHSSDKYSYFNLPSEISFGLRNFWLFNPDTDQMLYTLLCPSIEHLRLDFIMQVRQIHFLI